MPPKLSRDEAGLFLIETAYTVAIQALEETAGESKPKRRTRPEQKSIERHWQEIQSAHQRVSELVSANLLDRPGATRRK